MRRPKPNFLPGIDSSPLDIVHDLQEAADRRAALVQLAGRVEVARAEAEGDDAVGLAAQALDEALQALLLGRVDERLDGDVVTGPRLREELLDRALRLDGKPPDSSSAFVRSFASWTFGWSNGLISRIAPATAVANSQR